MSNREMVHEYIWTDGDEEFKAEPDSGVWYREGEKWLRGHNDWTSRYVREELLRVVRERNELANALATIRHMLPAEYQVCGDRRYGATLNGYEIESLDRLLREAGRS